MLHIIRGKEGVSVWSDIIMGKRWVHAQSQISEFRLKGKRCIQGNAKRMFRKIGIRNTENHRIIRHCACIMDVYGEIILSNQMAKSTKNNNDAGKRAKD